MDDLATVQGSVCQRICTIMQHIMAVQLFVYDRSSDKFLMSDHTMLAKSALRDVRGIGNKDFAKRNITDCVFILSNPSIDAALC